MAKGDGALAKAVREAMPRFKQAVKDALTGELAPPLRARLIEWQSDRDPAEAFPSFERANPFFVPGPITYKITLIAEEPLPSDFSEWMGQVMVIRPEKVVVEQEPAKKKPTARRHK